MLEIILGPSHHRKSQLVFNELRSRLDAGENSWLLVPEQFSLFTEKEIINRFGLPAQKRIKVLSFSRLCNLVLHQIGPLRMQYIDGAGKHIIAAQTMEMLSGKLIHLKHNLNQKGFSQILSDTISECKRYGVLPQALRFAADKTDNEEFSNKLEELALLYETYNNLLDAHLADAEDNLSLICPRLSSCDFLNGKLFIRHFRSFTPIEHKALGELMKIMDLSITLDYSNSPSYSGIFSPVGNTIKKLQKTTEELGLEPPKIIKSTPEDIATTPISYLRENYFNFKAKPYPTEDGIGLFEVQNRYREIECAADLILKLCRTEGYRFRDFLVLSRDTSGYGRILPSIFQNRGIKVFLDARQSISSKPLIRLLNGTLDILAFGHSYERIMTIARAEIFDIPRSDIDQFENYILAAAPTHSMWQTDIWDYQPGKHDFDMVSINHTKSVLLSGVKSIQDSISGTKTGGQIASAVLNWLKQSGLSQRISQLAEKALQNGNSTLADEYHQIWNSAISILAQLSAIMKDTPMTYKRFSELFAETCLGTEIGHIPQTLDSVIFSQIDRFRSNGAKVVIVLDMNEGSFPKGYNSEGFLSDGERYALEKLGIELAPGMESKRREEQLLIYAVLSAPEEKLYFFRSIQNNEGNLHQPSGIIKRIQELFPNLRIINPDTNGDPLSGAEGRESSFRLLATALSKCGGDSSRLSAPLKELYTWFKKSPDYQETLSQLYEAMNQPAPEQLSLDMVKKLYGAPLSLSASQLEVYNSCAFKYFLTYGLLLRERELAGLEPRSMGSIQHSALYSYFSELTKSNTDFSTITKEACFKAVGNAVEAESKKNSSLLYEASAYYKYIVLRMRDIAARTAWEVVKFYQSSSFRPYGFEIKIGTNGDVPALSVKAKDGREIAKIRGFIDRADSAEKNGKNLISIVDYKSSSKALDVTLAKDGIVIQPLLYSKALCDNLEKSTPAAMFYLQMNDPIISESDIKGDLELAIDKQMKPKGWIVNDADVVSAYATDGNDVFIPKEKATLITAKELEERMEMANQKILSAAEDIADGKIGIHPYRTHRHDACQYCKYNGVCQNQ